MSTQMMRAIRFHSFGPPEVLIVDSIPRPSSPGEGQVLVRVRAAGVNPFDAAMRAGLLQQRLAITLPAIPGVELSGTVEEVGPGVTFARGRAVYANTLANIGNGSNAEYVLLPVRTVAPMPRNIDFDQAASTTHGARTAWTGLFDGQRVLVQGGAGGVGMYVTQLAHLKGAHVITTTSGKNAKFVRSIGADEVIDYHQTNFEDVVKDVDMVYDTVGGDVMERSWQTLKPGGILISSVGFPAEETAKQLGVRCARVMFPKDLEHILNEVTTLVETGELKPQVREVFPMDKVAEAHALCETRHGRGRIVLHIAD